MKHILGQRMIHVYREVSHQDQNVVRYGKMLVYIGLASPSDGWVNQHIGLSEVPDNNGNLF